MQTANDAGITRVHRRYAWARAATSHRWGSFLPPKGDTGSHHEAEAREEEKCHSTQEWDAVVEARGGGRAGVEIARDGGLRAAHVRHDVEIARAVVHARLDVRVLAELVPADQAD